MKYLFVKIKRKEKKRKKKKSVEPLLLLACERVEPLLGQ
jgi:hypothetical protein